MEKLIINGGHSLYGTVDISGAKNAAVAILPAAIMVNNGISIIDNIPDIADIHCIERIIESLGCKVNRNNDCVSIDSTCLNNINACTDDVRKMRASYYLIGALLGRFKKARVELPGAVLLVYDL